MPTRPSPERDRRVVRSNPIIDIFTKEAILGEVNDKFFFFASIPSRIGFYYNIEDHLAKITTVYCTLISIILGKLTINENFGKVE